MVDIEYRRNIMDKYEAMRNTTKWIEECTIEEFLESFNSLEGDYSGQTIGEFVHDCIEDDFSNYAVQ